MSAMEKLSSILLDYGMVNDDINMLLGKFLEEEAEVYVECISIIKEQLSKKEKYLLS